MLRRAALFAFLGLILLSASPLFQRAGSSRAQTNLAGAPNCCGPLHPVAPRELDFPYYSLRDGFGSTLNLVSDSPKPIDLSIAIHGQKGQTVLTTASIQPEQKLSLDLRRTLRDLGADPTGEFGDGSIAVYYEGTIMPVVGQVTITNPRLNLLRITKYSDGACCSAGVPTGAFRR